MPTQLIKAKVQGCDLPSRVTFQDILLVKIHIQKVQDKGGP